MANSTTYPALSLTLRFPSDLPDLRLPLISDPTLVTGLSLLPNIRNNLPIAQHALRIILIHGGRIVPLKEPLSSSLRLPSSKTLGKTRARSVETDAADDGVLHWIIHATFSAPDDPLSLEELAIEKCEGEELNASLQRSVDRAQSVQNGSQFQDGRVVGGLSTIANGPRGFDRLAEAGIPTTEITGLRTQFRSLLVASRPEDALLTPMEILDLEERWLDDSTFSAGDESDGNFASFNNGSDIGSGLGSGSSRIDDVLWGNILGFFWPLGAVFWLGRQDGVWNQTRGLGVVVGFMINIGFCFIRAGLVGSAGV